MNISRISAIALSLSLTMTGCAHSEKPLQVLPTQPIHPRLTPPPAELMEMDCKFLPPTICKPGRTQPKSN